ncbi:MAG TPA: N-acetyl-gamma-glutamyl-phosphate reductase [Thermoplasmata archaeon]|jgi:N-acetyl-gamma-glutamyl-phosphate reductase|nr:N-acetyl-gamma-glutamyl-phosphate reductase [Thermoplasmata archaeon]
MAKAAVLGASGYLGGELLRLLSYHPDLELTEAVSRSQAGKTVGAVAPNVERFADLVIRPEANGIDADVAFLAQGAGEAMTVVPTLLERGIRVVDLGPDYRLPVAAEYERVYGRPHADPDHLGEAVYGLPELFGDQVRKARLVANPGCFPTATLLALAPLAAAAEIQGPVVVDAKTGSSGAGAQPTSNAHHPEAALTVLPYGAPEHRHAPEMAAALGRLGAGPVPIVFVPHLVPLVRGIFCSIYASPAGAADAGRWADLYAARYQASPFVRVGGVPRLPWAQGTNRCYLSVQAVSGAPVVFSALDNLGKGGAAQAIQNANLMLGLDETSGLAHPGFGV